MSATSRVINMTLSRNQRTRFLNLMVVLAAPRACFMMENERTLYGSPSISSVIPFLMSEVSTATASEEEARENAGAGTKAHAEATSNESSSKTRIVNIQYMYRGTARDCNEVCGHGHGHGHGRMNTIFYFPSKNVRQCVSASVRSVHVAHQRTECPRWECRGNQPPRTPTQTCSLYFILLVSLERSCHHGND